MLASPRKLAFMQRVSHAPSLEELIDFVGDKFDFILIEGFKESGVPRIEVHRKELGCLISPPDRLIAVVTDEPLDVPVPQFSSCDGLALVDLLEKRFATPSGVGTASSDG